MQIGQVVQQVQVECADDLLSFALRLFAEIEHFFDKVREKEDNLEQIWLLAPTCLAHDLQVKVPTVVQR
jgi:hypothetical protein